MAIIIYLLSLPDSSADDNSTLSTRTPEATLDNIFRTVQELPLKVNDPGISPRNDSHESNSTCENDIPSFVDMQKTEEGTRSKEDDRENPNEAQGDQYDTTPDTDVAVGSSVSSETDSDIETDGEYELDFGIAVPELENAREVLDLQLLESPRRKAEFLDPPPGASVNTSADLYSGDVPEKTGREESGTQTTSQNSETKVTSKHLKLPSTTGHAGKSILSRSSGEGKSKNWFLSLTSREKLDANKKSERVPKVEVKGAKKRDKGKDREKERRERRERREKDREREKRERDKEQEKDREKDREKIIRERSKDRDREKITEKSRGKDKRKDKDREEEIRKKKGKGKDRNRQKATKSKVKDKDREGDKDKSKTKSKLTPPSNIPQNMNRSPYTPPLPTTPPPPLPLVPILSISLAMEDTTFEENRYITKTRAATSLTTTEDEWGILERGKGRDCSSTEEYWKNDKEGEVGAEGEKSDTYHCLYQQGLDIPGNSDKDSERALSGTEEFVFKTYLDRPISKSGRKAKWSSTSLEGWNEATWSETWTDTSNSESIQPDFSKMRLSDSLHTRTDPSPQEMHEASPLALVSNGMYSKLTKLT